MFGYIQSYKSKDKNFKNYLQIKVDQRYAEQFGQTDLYKAYFYKFESLLPLLRKYEALMSIDKCSFSKMIINPFNSPIIKPGEKLQEYLNSNQGKTNECQQKVL